MWGLGLELPGFGLGLGFYNKVTVSVSSRNLSQVTASVSEVTVSTTSLQRAPRKRKSTANNDNACQSSSKQDNAADVLPVILESQSDRKLRAYSPLLLTIA